VDSWISVEQQPPESGRKVIAFYKENGRARKITAQWLDQYAEECDPDMPDDFGEWGPPGDVRYCPSGWYETCEHSPIDCYAFLLPPDHIVTHWQPLPPDPDAPLWSCSKCVDLSSCVSNGVCMRAAFGADAPLNFAACLCPFVIVDVNAPPVAPAVAAAIARGPCQVCDDPAFCNERGGCVDTDARWLARSSR